MLHAGTSAGQWTGILEKEKQEERHLEEPSFLIYSFNTRKFFRYLNNQNQQTKNKLK